MKVKRKVPVRQYTRTVGYFASVEQTNKGKREEIRERKLIGQEQIRGIVYGKESDGRTKKNIAKSVL